MLVHFPDHRIPCYLTVQRVHPANPNPAYGPAVHSANPHANPRRRWRTRWCSSWSAALPWRATCWPT